MRKYFTDWLMLSAVVTMNEFNEWYCCNFFRGKGGAESRKEKQRIIISMVIIMRGSASATTICDLMIILIAIIIIIIAVNWERSRWLCNKQTATHAQFYCCFAVLRHFVRLFFIFSSSLGFYSDDMWDEYCSLLPRWKMWFCIFLSRRRVQKCKQSNAATSSPVFIMAHRFLCTHIFAWTERESTHISNPVFFFLRWYYQTTEKKKLVLTNKTRVIFFCYITRIMHTPPP